MKRRSVLNQPKTAAAAGAALFVFLSSTNPRSLAVPFLVVPVITLFCILFVLSKWTIGKIFSENQMTGSTTGIVAAALAMGPVILLALASINQLTARDIILASLFVIGLAWYFSRQALNSEVV